VKQRIVLLTVLTATVCFYAYGYVAALVNEAQRQNGIVKIIVREHNGTYASGSGVVVGDNYVVTAKHVVEGTCHVMVNAKEASIVALSKGHDLALLHVRELNVTPLPILHSPPRGGESLVAVGYPHMGDRMAFFGNAIYTDRDLVVTSARVEGGQSGGALLAMRVKDRRHHKWYVAGITVGFFVTVLGDGTKIENNNRSVSVSPVIVSEFVNKYIQD